MSVAKPSRRRITVRDAMKNSWIEVTTWTADESPETP